MYSNGNRQTFQLNWNEQCKEPSGHSWSEYFSTWNRLHNIFKQALYNQEQLAAVLCTYLYLHSHSVRAPASLAVCRLWSVASSFELLLSSSFDHCFFLFVSARVAGDSDVALLSWLNRLFRLNTLLLKRIRLIQFFRGQSFCDWLRKLNYLEANELQFCARSVDWNF